MQPTFEAVEIACTVCKAAAAVYVPSNLARGTLMIDCYGCGTEEGVIEYFKTDYPDGKSSKRLIQRVEVEL